MTEPADPASDEPAPAKAPEPASEPASAPEPGLVVWLQKIDRFLGNVEEAVLVFLVAVLIFAASYQAYKFRFQNQTPEWSNEVIRFSVFFIAMTGAALAAHSRKLLAMDVFTRFLSPRKRSFVKVVSALFTVFICVMLVRGGLAVRESVVGEEGVVMNPSTAILAIPIGSTVMGFHVLLHLVIDSIYLARGSVAPEDESMPLH